MIRVCVNLFAALCIFFALLPLFIYSIFNTGTAALLATGLTIIILPRLWNTALVRFPRLRALIAFGCALAAALALVISVLIARRAWFTPPPDQGSVAVIVLGSKINGDQPSLMLRRRLNAALDYMELNPEAICVVSGGQGADELYTEAEVMRNYLVANGVNESRVLMEDASTNTQQNIAYSAKLIPGIQQVAIATDSFHQLRASLFAKAEGLEPYSLSSLTPWGLMPAYWAREILGVMWAWLSTKTGYAGS